MTHKIRYSQAEEIKASPLVGVFRSAILVGVWILVGLAGFAVWAKLYA